MLTIGDSFPNFELAASVKCSDDLDEAFETITNDSFEGRWKVYFFWPKDFTFVCPTEIQGFGEIAARVEKAGGQLLGASLDSEFVHNAWRKHEPRLTDSPFPWLADIGGKLTEALGILREDAGVAMRATFIVDPKNTIQWVSVYGAEVGRDPKEVLRALEATIDFVDNGSLMPCAWTPGQAPLTPGK